jgi:hypothetical protein
MESTEGTGLNEYSLAFLIVSLPFGVLLYLYLRAIQRSLKGNLPVIPESLPENCILYGFHEDYYSVMAVGNLHRFGSKNLFWLGYHGFFSYIPFLWFRRNHTRVFRYKFRGGQRPFDQIVTFLEKNPSIRFALGTDSGRPYGRVRESLIKLAIRTNRPVVGLRVRPSRRIRFLGHDLPLSGSSFHLRVTEAVSPESLRALTLSDAREIVQRKIDVI